MDTVEITRKEIVNLDDVKTTISSLQTEIAILEKLSDKEKVIRYNAEFIDPLKRRLASEQKTLTDLSALKVEPIKDVNYIQ
jgi:hypothetical protein